MSTTDTEDAGERDGGRSFLSWKLILPAFLLLAAAGGGAGYFYYYHFGGHGRAAASQEPPLPFYLTIKPFVVSIGSQSGSPHFVQLGASLTLAGPAVGKLVDAMLPEVEDTMRLTALTFKAEDVTTPAGVDKMRALMTANINRLLLQRLGAARIKAINNGKKDIVQNIYFSTLVVE
jgi:flagellar basal body-associated protein FliL